MLPADAYGCVVANRFGNLLDDDADPFDLMSEADMTQEKKKKRKEEEKRTKQRKTGQKESQKDRRLPLASAGPERAQVHKQQQQQALPRLVTESREGKEEVQRGTKRAAFGERKVHQEEYPQEFSISKPPSNADSDFRTREGMSGRRGRGGYTRNSDNVNPRGKREYDRHNGTGISPEEKRGGRGPWNWGSVEEAASDLVEEPQMPVEEENPNQGTEKDGEMVVQVAMEMTLDEWKALKETRRPKVEFNIRKAENKIPTEAKVIHQSNQLEKVKGTLTDMEDDGNFLRKSVNDITSLLNINFGSLGRPTRGSRGMKGGPTNRPERAKPVMEKEDELAPDPDDPEDFPELSAGRLN